MALVGDMFLISLIAVNAECEIPIALSPDYNQNTESEHALAAYYDCR